MIAIDTNVLLRYLLQDNLKQSEKASVLINGEEDVLVTNVVLAETLWTLCGKKYNATQSNVVSTIQALFEEPKIVFEDPQTVWQTLDDYVKSNGRNLKKLDFQDALILNCAKKYALQRAEGLSGFYTFDKAAQRLPGAMSP